MSETHSVTPQMVEAQYHAALESLTTAQTDALAMLRRAYQLERTNNLTANENLKRVFEEVAARRNATATST